jgi:hypothetical protein
MPELECLLHKFAVVNKLSVQIVTDVEYDRMIPKPPNCGVV